VDLEYQELLCIKIFKLLSKNLASLRQHASDPNIPTSSNQRVITCPIPGRSYNLKHERAELLRPSSSVPDRTSHQQTFGFDSRQCKIFLHSTASVSYRMDAGATSPGRGRRVNLTTNLHLVSRLRKVELISILLYVFMK
jgi:hypothetical protein